MSAHDVRIIPGLDALPDLVGQELGVSPWITVDQEQIDQFAGATRDHQWIHVDAERAAAGPFGSTVAHGYLTLSLLPYLVAQSYHIEGVGMAVNYGLNRVRFPQPVPSGSHVRSRSRLLTVDQRPDGSCQIVVEQTIELSGATRPACVAETVSLLRP